MLGVILVNMVVSVGFTHMANTWEREHKKGSFEKNQFSLLGGDITTPSSSQDKAPAASPMTSSSSGISLWNGGNKAKGVVNEQNSAAASWQVEVPNPILA